MQHVILTRFNNGIYDRPDAYEWMKHRLELFKATKESVLSQDAAFDWVVSFDERTPIELMDEVCTFPTMHPVTDLVQSFQPDGWLLSTRLDNDDILLPNAIEEIQTAAKMFKGREMVIDIDYRKRDFKGVYPSNRPRANSPFLSLMSERKNCYCRPHTFMPDDFPSYKIDKVLAEMVIHDKNAANTVNS